MVTKEVNLSLSPNLEFAKLATDVQIQNVTRALEANGIKVVVAETAEEAKQIVLNLVPQGAEVYANLSKTLEVMGLAEQFDQSGRYNAVRPKVLLLDRKTQADEIRKLRTIPDYIVGSVHAITEAGEVITASGTGSQISSYAYGAGKVIWVAGTQKIVSDLNEGFRRTREYSQRLEDARMQQAYGINSSLNKTLVITRDMPGRITLVLVKENIGF